MNHGRTASHNTNSRSQYEIWSKRKAIDRFDAYIRQHTVKSTLEQHIPDRMIYPFLCIKVCGLAQCQKLSQVKSTSKIMHTTMCWNFLLCIKQSRTGEQSSRPCQSFLEWLRTGLYHWTIIAPPVVSSDWTAD